MIASIRMPLNLIFIIIMGMLQIRNSHARDLPLVSTTTSVSSRWLNFGPGVFKSTKYAVLQRYRKKAKRDEIDVFLVTEEKDILSLVNWMQNSLGKAIKLKPKGDFDFAEYQSYSLTTYSDEKSAAEEYLMYVPLNFVFETFGDVEFDELLRMVNAKFSKEKSSQR